MIRKFRLNLSGLQRSRKFKWKKKISAFVKKSAMSVRFSRMKIKLSASLRGQNAVRKNAWEEMEEKVKSERDIEDLLEE